MSQVKDIGVATNNGFAKIKEMYYKKDADTFEKLVLPEVERVDANPFIVDVPFPVKENEKFTVGVEATTTKGDISYITWELESVNDTATDGLGLLVPKDYDGKATEDVVYIMQPDNKTTIFTEPGTITAIDTLSNIGQVKDSVPIMTATEYGIGKPDGVTCIINDAGELVCIDTVGNVDPVQPGQGQPSTPDPDVDADSYILLEKYNYNGIITPKAKEATADQDDQHEILLYTLETSTHNLALDPKFSNVTFDNDKPQEIEFSFSGYIGDGVDIEYTQPNNFTKAYYYNINNLKEIDIYYIALFTFFFSQNDDFLFGILSKHMCDNNKFKMLIRYKPPVDVASQFSLYNIAKYAIISPIPITKQKYISLQDNIVLQQYHSGRFGFNGSNKSSHYTNIYGFDYKDIYLRVFRGVGVQDQKMNFDFNDSFRYNTLIVYYY